MERGKNRQIYIATKGESEVSLCAPRPNSHVIARLRVSRVNGGHLVVLAWWSVARARTFRFTTRCAPTTDHAPVTIYVVRLKPEEFRAPFPPPVHRARSVV